MPINFPLIDPSKTQFNKGIGQEIGTPIAQAILAAAQRRKEQKEREAVTRFLQTGEYSDGMSKDVLEKIAAEKARPGDFGDMIAMGNLQRGLTTDEEKRQQLAREGEGKSVESGALGALLGINTIPDKTLTFDDPSIPPSKRSGAIDPGFTGRSQLMQRWTGQYGDALRADRTGRGQLLSPEVSAAPGAALERALKPASQERIANTSYKTFRGYDPTSSRSVYSDSKSGQLRYSDTDEPYSGGPLMPNLAHLSAEETSRNASFGVVGDLVDVLKRLHKSSYVGPIQGRLGKLSNKYLDNFADDKRAEFQGTLASIRNAILQAKSGLVITPQEAERLMQELPNEDATDTDWIGKMVSFERWYNTFAANRNRAFRGAGYMFAPLGGSSQQTDGMTPEQEAEQYLRGGR